MLCIKLTPLQNIQSEGILGVKKPQKINVFIRQLHFWQDYEVDQHQCPLLLLYDKLTFAQESSIELAK